MILEYQMTRISISEFRSISEPRKTINLKPTVYGVGINDSAYKSSIRVNGKYTECPAYRIWRNMLQRCYSTKFHENNPTYTRCTVSKEWLSLSAFRAWMSKQDYHHKHIDKDLLHKGNTMYSPSNCLFVPPEINNLLTDNRAIRGEYPQGVHKKYRKYIAEIRTNGKKRYIGSYNTIKDAERAYNKRKSEHIKDISKLQQEPLRSALMQFI